MLEVFAAAWVRSLPHIPGLTEVLPLDSGQSSQVFVGIRKRLSQLF